jgi:hypothetical protein
VHARCLPGSVSAPGDRDVGANGRDDQLFAILTGVASVAVARGTAVAWAAAWEIVRRTRVDVAAVAARTLFAARPADAPIPEAVLDFEPVLSRAGLLGR